MSAANPIRDLLKQAETRLAESGVPNARRNAEWMLCDALGCSILDLYTWRDGEPNRHALDTFREHIERRSRREPLQYILGTTEFMSLPFVVAPGVFVPRPDTEILVELAEERLRAMPLHRQLRVVDLCCGSGVVGVSLAARIPNLEVVLVDASPEAVQMADHNATANGVEERAILVEADAALQLEMMQPDSCVGVVCNPPYIESAEIARLPCEVRDHEPHLALDGGADGLDVYRRLIPLLAEPVSPGGFVMFEIGDAQGAAVSAMLSEAGFDEAEVITDLAGRDRVVAASLPTRGGEADG